MANTKKTTSTTEERVAKVDNTVNIKSLEKQVQEQQEQIKQLMEMLRNNVAVPVITESNDVGADEEILVISLTPNKLNLVGNDGSVLFAFDNMYDSSVTNVISRTDGIVILLFFSIFICTLYALSVAAAAHHERYGLHQHGRCIQAIPLALVPRHLADAVLYTQQQLVQRELVRA